MVAAATPVPPVFPRRPAAAVTTEVVCAGWGGVLVGMLEGVVMVSGASRREEKIEIVSLRLYYKKAKKEKL